MKKRIVDLIKSALGNVEFAIRGFNYSSDELIVLCMHSTPADQMLAFEKLIDFLLKHFKPMHPSQLENYYSGNLKDGPYVLFTFDDGLKNNLHVARLLAQRKIHAYFFLVPAFIQSQDQKAYYRTNIRQEIDFSFDKHNDDFISMSVSDVRHLLMAGHKVGSHTMTHLLRGESAKEEVAKEVSESKSVLQELIDTEVLAFCSPINTAMSVNEYAKHLIGKQYKYHFTTFPGLNGAKKNQQLIFRRNIEVNWSSGKIKFALGRCDLHRWDQHVARYVEM